MSAPSMPREAPERAVSGAKLACAAALVAAVAAVYWGGLHGAFVFDDDGSIAANPSIRELATALSPPAGATVSGRPFLNLTFALNYAASGLAPLGYHALNVAFHATSALLLFGIIRRTLAAPAAGAHPPGETLALAFAASLLWALHPLQVGSVAYVAQRAESLMGLLYLLTLYAFIRGAAGGPRSVAWFAGAFGACLLGMGTKETMVTAPLLVLLYDRTFVAGSFREAWRAHKAILLALAACWVPLAVQVAHTGGRAGTAGFDSGVSAWPYFQTQMKAVVLYLRLAAWPRPLVGDYGRVLAANPLEILACASLVAAVAAATLVLLVKRPALGFLGAAFLGLLAPSSSFVPVATETIALHRMYLPLAALVVVGVLALARVCGAGRLFGAFVLALALGLAAVTVRRVRVYDGPRAFWSDVALKAPWNAGAWNNLGLIRAAEGDSKGAFGAYRRALEIAPSFATARFNLGKAFLAAGRAAEAEDQLEKAMVFLKADPSLHEALGRAYALQQKTLDAVRELHEVVALDADRADAWFDLGALMEQAGNLGEAAYCYGKAVHLTPNYPEARLNYGNVLAQQGHLPEAITQYEEDLLLEPKAADVHNNLGSLLAEAGRLAEAKAQFAQALQLKPDYGEARDNLEHVRRLMGEGISP